jgi:hypothetical protein
MQSEFEFGQVLGNGESGSVYEVKGNPHLVAKVLHTQDERDRDDLEQELLAMQLMSAFGMSPKAYEIISVDDSKTGTAVLIMDRLEGPELSEEDFEDPEVQARLVEIAITASRCGICANDAHPANYMWHKKQVLRIDAYKAPVLSKYGFRQGFMPRTIFRDNFCFTDCVNSQILLSMQRALEFDFDLKRTLARELDVEMLAKVRFFMAPHPEKAKQVAKPLVQLNGVDADDDIDVDVPQKPHLNLVTFVRDTQTANTTTANWVWTADLVSKLEQTIIGLSIGRFYLRKQQPQDEQDPLSHVFILRGDGELVCKEAVKADEMIPTSHIWLANTDFKPSDLEGLQDQSLRNRLIMFAFAVRIAFTDSFALQAAPLISFGAKVSLRRLRDDLWYFHSQIIFGHFCGASFKTFNLALRQLGIKRTLVGQVFDFLLEHLV